MDSQNGFNGQQNFNQQGFQQQGFNQSQQNFQQQSFQQQGFNQPQQNFQQQGFNQPQQNFNFQQDFNQQQNFTFQQQGFNQQSNMNSNLSPANIPKSRMTIGKILFIILLLFVVIVGVGVYKKKLSHDETVANNTSSQQDGVNNLENYENVGNTENSENSEDIENLENNESSDNTVISDLDNEDSKDNESNITDEEVDVSEFAETGVVELKHGQNYNYVVGDRDFILLNDRVELFKKINVKDPKKEVLKPSKGNVFLGLFLSVTNRSTEEDFINVMFKGYANDTEIKTVSDTTLDKLEGYEIDSYVKGESTKKICLLYEVPKKTKEFELRDDYGLILTVSLLKDNAKGDEER